MRDRTSHNLTHYPEKICPSTGLGGPLRRGFRKIHAFSSGQKGKHAAFFRQLRASLLFPRSSSLLSSGNSNQKLLSKRRQIPE